MSARDDRREDDWAEAMERLRGRRIRAQQVELATARSVRRTRGFQAATGGAVALASAVVVFGFLPVPTQRLAWTAITFVTVLMWLLFVESVLQYCRARARVLAAAQEMQRLTRPREER